MTHERQRRSDGDRADILERWQQSGLTAREFAEQEGLKTSSLYLWRKQQRAAAQCSSDSGAHKPVFSELRLSTAPTQPSHVEIVARNGRVVRVHGDISVRALQQVLAAVEQC